MIAIGIAPPEMLDSVCDFYSRGGEDVALSPDERIMIAQGPDGIVGAARICREENVMVLRTMLVNESFRSRGIGMKLLLEMAERLEGQACYCIPYRSVVPFYRRIGFEVIADEAAPEHLRDRLIRYRGEGHDSVVMRC